MSLSQNPPFIQKFSTKQNKRSESKYESVDNKKEKGINNIYPLLSVRDEIRTHTSQRPLPPQSSVSTNSTTRTVLQYLLESAQNRTRTCMPLDTRT